MTEDEFFAALEKTPRDWYFDVGKLIRRREGDMKCCPIIALDPHGPTWACLYPTSADRLGISEEFRRLVANSADNVARNTGYYSPAIRARLLAACGLTEHA